MMESPWPENFSFDRKKAIEELVRGQEFLTQLRNLLQKRTMVDLELVSGQDLVVKISDSFANVLSVLNSGESSDVCHSRENNQLNSPCSDDRKSDDSGNKKKIPATKGGVHKRRKTSSNTWTRVTPTPTPINDGYAWRKYGQKEILNAKFPRNYFRCTHKHDQGCQATKQMQRTEEDPPMYLTTYMGHHTCRATLKAPQLILDTSPRDSFVFNFESNVSNKQEFPFFAIKQESKDEILISDLTHNYSSEYLLPTLESNGPTTMLASTSGSDHGDVMSGVYECSTSSPSLDMDLLVESVDFDTVFRFDDDEFKPQF